MLTTTAPYTAGETTITTDGGISLGASGMRRRLRALIPPEWFADDVPIFDGLLSGVSALLAHAATLILYARAQTRVTTSTGGFLDVSALDFFGARFPRRRGEIDRDYQLRIRREVVRPRVTRAAIVAAVTDITGYAPDVFEPWNPGDCGGLGFGFALAGGTTQSARIGGYGSYLGGLGVGGFAFVLPAPGPSGSSGRGCWGSLELPDQIFVRVHRNAGTIPDAEGLGGLNVSGRLGGGSNGNPAISGLGGSLGGLGVGPGAALYVPDGPTQAVTGVGAYAEAGLSAPIDAEIARRIASTVAGGVIAWTTIQSDRRA